MMTRDELNTWRRAVEAARLERDQARADVVRLRTHLVALVERQRDWLALGDHPPGVVARLNRAQAAIDLSLIHDPAPWRPGAGPGAAVVTLATPTPPAPSSGPQTGPGVNVSGG